MQDKQEQETVEEQASEQEQETVEENEVVMIDDNETMDDIEYGPPRGTVAFVTLMLIAYILYYGYHYIEIIILRGA